MSPCVACRGDSLAADEPCPCECHDPTFGIDPDIEDQLEEEREDMLYEVGEDPCP